MSSFHLFAFHSSLMCLWGWQFPWEHHCSDFPHGSGGVGAGGCSCIACMGKESAGELASAQDEQHKGRLAQPLTLELPSLVASPLGDGLGLNASFKELGIGFGMLGAQNYPAGWQWGTTSPLILLLSYFLALVSIPEPSGMNNPLLLGWQVSHRGSLPLGVQVRGPSERQGRRCAPAPSVVHHTRQMACAKEILGVRGSWKWRAHQWPDHPCCGLQPVYSPRKLVSLRSCNLCPSFNSEN